MFSPLEQAAIHNRLLAALGRDDFAGLAPMLERVSHPLRAVLIGAHEPITHAYFIEDGLVSLITGAADDGVEIGVVGREGLVGVPLVLGTDRTPHAAVVQADLVALRIDAVAFRRALRDRPGLRGVMGRYVQSLIVQVGQTVQANAMLTVEGRLARWILMTRDRLDGDELPFTHEFLAMMLGVRRPGVTTAVHALEGMRLIRARRGRIAVLDRERLEDLADGTYGPAEAEYERLLAGPPEGSP